MSSNRERAHLDANKKRKSKRKDYVNDETTRHYERKIRKSLEKDRFDKYKRYDEEGF
jgi:hypothetical protein